jgi:hypothetical protein
MGCVRLRRRGFSHRPPDASCSMTLTIAGITAACIGPRPISRSVYSAFAAECSTVMAATQSSRRSFLRLAHEDLGSHQYSER